MLFVIDTSGSMCVTTAIEGKLALRGDRTKDMNRLLGVGVSSPISLSFSLSLPVVGLLRQYAKYGK